MCAKVPTADINGPITAVTSPPPGGYLQKFTPHLATGGGGLRFQSRNSKWGRRSKCGRRGARLEAECKQGDQSACYALEKQEQDAEDERGHLN